MPDFYIWYTPSEGEDKNDPKNSAMCTDVCVVMETWFGKWGYNLKVTQNICYSITYLLSIAAMDTFSKFRFSNSNIFPNTI